MPGVGIHYLALEKIIEELKGRDEKKCKSLAETLETYSDFAYLGSIGPDLTFFLETGPQLAGHLTKLINFDDELRETFGARAQRGRCNEVDRIGIQLCL